MTKDMKASQIFDYVIERLKSERFMVDFKFRKRDCRFIWHKDGVGGSLDS